MFQYLPARSGRYADIFATFLLCDFRPNTLYFPTLRRAYFIFRSRIGLLGRTPVCLLTITYFSTNCPSTYFFSADYAAVFTLTNRYWSVFVCQLWSSYPHILMSSCPRVLIHVFIPHSLMTSCPHDLMFSCHHVLFPLLIRADPGLHQAFTCQCSIGRMREGIANRGNERNAPKRVMTVSHTNLQLKEPHFSTCPYSILISYR